ncbi:LysR family transcriptional regulator [Luteibacter sp. PPL201]|uniref:LysR family transcriptional regulator n=1 Tax=Luteibacter sahnii TaxID=3021977 RepID=A0ABT6B7B6_9GAMM|nr:LysR family transcriptional regulator [Luteibacter sp. PPL193]MDY1548126.1 LysR family transcriptional regulator [Luteibacter sp. PPL193]
MSFKPSELPLLVSLDVLLEERNVTRAAARLHVSQPALSGQLARLRRLFKDPLLVPSETGRGMVATPKAEEIGRPLREALRRLDAVGHAEVAFDPHVDAATFRLRGSCGAVDLLTPPLFTAIERCDNPSLRVVLQVDDDSGDMLALFESGELDLALVPSTRVPPSLKVRELISEPVMLVHRAGHDCATHPAIDLDTYCALRHAVVSPAGKLCDDMDRHLREMGRHRDVVASAASSHALRGMLAGTDLVCCVPSSMATGLGDALRTRPLGFRVPPVTLTMAWHARLDKQSSHRWLREQVARFVSPASRQPPMHPSPIPSHA